MPNTAKFPAAIATNSDLLIATNNASCTLNGTITSSATTILTSVQSPQIVTPCAISIDNEIILIASGTTTQLNVASGGRGFDGTTAASHNNGATINVNVVAWSHNQAIAEIEAIESFLGTNGTNLGSVGLIAALFNWSQTPGGSLSPGSNVVTLTPVPPGVNGTGQNHYVYVANGTGTAEACLITGGTAVSGAASGTIIFTAANSHSGAWTVQSAQGGLKEAMNVLPVTGGIVYAPRGQVSCYAPLYVGNGTPTAQSTINSIGLYGQGSGRGGDIAVPTAGGTTLKWLGAASAGPVVKVMGPIGQCALEDFQIDCNNLADIGLDIVHSYVGSFRRLSIVGWNSIGLRAVAVDYNFPLMVTGCNNNTFDTVIVDAQGSGAGASSVAGQFGQAVPNVNSIFDFASNYFVNSSFLNFATGGTAMELRFVDNCTFNQTVSFASGTALKFTAVGTFPASNVWIQSPIIGPIVAVPSTFTAVGPNFMFPLSDGDTPQNAFALQNFIYGVENTTGAWFGRFKNAPLFYACVSNPAAIANTTSEVAFGRSYNVRANLLNYIGTMLRVRGSGRYSTTGSPSLTLRVKLGALVIGTFVCGTASGASNAAFNFDSSAGVNTAGVGALLIGPSFGFVAGSNPVTSSTLGGQGIDTTIDNTLTVTVQWGTASPSNTILLDNLTVEVTYPGASQ